MEPDRLSGGRAAPELRVFSDPAALARGAAAEVLRRGRRARRARGRFDLALAGGSTPLELYATLASARSARDGLWTDTRLFWGDERMVAPDDPASNYGAAWRTGLDHLAVPPTEVHRVPGESGDPGRAAVIYEAELRSCFPGAAWPRFDLVLLGLGTDGHIASLLPGSAALGERERWVAAVTEGGSPPVPRVTLTLPVLNSTASLLVLVSGAAKAEVLKRVRGPAGADPLPAQRLRPAGAFLVFADRAAAGVD